MKKKESADEREMMGLLRCLDSVQHGEAVTMNALDLLRQNYLDLSVRKAKKASTRERQKKAILQIEEAFTEVQQMIVARMAENALGRKP